MNELVQILKDEGTQTEESSSSSYSYHTTLSQSLERMHFVVWKIQYKIKDPLVQGMIKNMKKVLQYSNKQEEKHQPRGEIWKGLFPTKKMKSA